MCATPSESAIRFADRPLFLNVKDVVREISLRSLSEARLFSSSSVNPSENHSWSFVGEMFENGSTTNDLSMAAFGRGDFVRPL